MRIESLHAIHLITTIDRGGAERQLLTLCKYQVNQGMKVTVIPLKGRMELMKDFSSLDVHVNSKVTNRNPVVQMVVLHLMLRKSKNTLLHLHLPRAEILGSLASLLTKNWRVLSKHNSEPFLTKGPKVLSRTLAGIAFVRTHKVVCISNAVKEYLQDVGEIKTNSRKVHVVYYGIDFSPNIQELGVGIGNEKYKTSSLVLGTVCRLTPQKDLFTMLDAFAIVLQQRSDARLKIVGVGELEIELKEYSKFIGIAHAVDWLGSQHNPYSALGRVDLFVLTSRYEGFGLVVLEWISRKKPVVVSRIPPLQEILGNDYPLFSEVGNAKDFAEKILKATVKSNYTDELNRYERIRKKFDYRKMGAELENVYRDILKDK